MYNKLNGWGYGHEMPVFKKQPFHEIARNILKDEDKKGNI